MIDELEERLRAQRAALKRINRTVDRLADQLIEKLDEVIRDDMREARDAEAAAKAFIRAGGTKEEWEEIFIRVYDALQQEIEPRSSRAGAGAVRE